MSLSDEIIPFQFVNIYNYMILPSNQDEPKLGGKCYIISIKGKADKCIILTRQI
jgi:hypothetical protein